MKITEIKSRRALDCRFCYSTREAFKKKPFPLKFYEVKNGGLFVDLCEICMIRLSGALKIWRELPANADTINKAVPGY